MAQVLLSHTDSMSARDASFWVNEDLQFVARDSTTLNCLSYTGRGSRQSCRMMYKEEWTEALSPQLGLCEVPQDSRVETVEEIKNPFVRLLAPRLSRDL